MCYTINGYNSKTEANNDFAHRIQISKNMGQEIKKISKRSVFSNGCAFHKFEKSYIPDFLYTFVKNDNSLKCRMMSSTSRIKNLNTKFLTFNIGDYIIYYYDNKRI